MLLGKQRNFAKVAYEVNTLGKAKKNKFGRLLTVI